MICSCSNLTAVSVFVCLTSIPVSSANVSSVLLVVVGMFAVYNVYSIGPRTLPCVFWKILEAVILVCKMQFGAGLCLVYVTF